MPKIVCFWPGLPQLWLRGSWSGLALAAGSALLLNFVLTATFVWTEWLGASLLNTGWVALVALWGGSAWVSTTRGYSTPVVAIAVPAPSEPVDEDLFREVYGQYLQGNWFEAESLLTAMIGRNPRDAEAQLLLATLRRHTGRLDEAEATLARLLKQDEAVRWEQEIQREKRLIGEARFELDDDQNDDDQNDQPADEDVTDDATGGRGGSTAASEDSSSDDRVAGKELNRDEMGGHAEVNTASVTSGDGDQPEKLPDAEELSDAA